ncbi:hypothetical protein BJ875DRAFT_545906 [Amylocarpus encephaloides]|uniref:DUF7918 domain-containing protein n=1 Tax=Amylocarpus encephaloides TaxID=45428 RepID=A0A9P7YBR2_9HELO|nr:hypothetical protein BJ875DRAFT_545906 [Amylocarpus encephaloides]
MKSLVHPGLSVRILAAGSPIDEHEDPDSAECTSSHEDPHASEYQTLCTKSRHIEAITNQEFGIECSLGPPISLNMDPKVKFYIYIDGVLATEHTFARPEVKKNGFKGEHVVTGVQEGKGRNCTERKFKFSEIKMGCQSQKQEREIEKIGTIDVYVYGENFGRQGGQTPGNANGFLQPNMMSIPEKALKGADAKSHGTILEKARKVRRSSVWRTEKKTEDYPLAMFRYTYRSMEALRQLGVIYHEVPLNPSASRTSSPGMLAPEEADAALLERLRRLEKEAKYVKSQLSSSLSANKDKGSKRIKQEDIRSEDGPRKRAKRANPAKSIDLIGDDDERMFREDSGSGPEVTKVACSQTGRNEAAQPFGQATRKMASKVAEIKDENQVPFADIMGRLLS